MGEVTGISWTDHSWNPWEGCTKTSPGCLNCYAKNLNARWGKNNWGPGAERRVTSGSTWNEPIRWAKKAAAAGVREKVFGGSMCDIFDHEAPVMARRAFWQLIRSTSYSLDWQIVTKRANRIRMVMQEDRLEDDLFLKNRVWLITSTENQEWLDKRVPYLLDIPAAVHGISAEPLLGALDVSKYLKVPCSVCDGEQSLPVPIRGGYKPCHNCFDSKNGQGYANSLDWVIAGFESQHGARVGNPDHARSLRDQCKKAGVAFFYKQNGEFLEESEAQKLLGENVPARKIEAHNLVFIKIGTKQSGCLLDGEEHKEFPRVA